MLKKYLNSVQGVTTVSLFIPRPNDLIACSVTLKYALAVIPSHHIQESPVENIEKSFHSKKRRVRKSLRWLLKESRNALNVVSLLKEVMVAIL
jgi:hypothetical protein